MQQMNLDIITLLEARKCEQMAFILESLWATQFNVPMLNSAQHASPRITGCCFLSDGLMELLPLYQAHERGPLIQAEAVHIHVWSS